MGGFQTSALGLRSNCPSAAAASPARGVHAPLRTERRFVRRSPPWAGRLGLVGRSTPVKVPLWLDHALGLLLLVYLGAALASWPRPTQPCSPLHRFNPFGSSCFGRSGRREHDSTGRRLSGRGECSSGGRSAAGCAPMARSSALPRTWRSSRHVQKHHPEENYHYRVCEETPAPTTPSASLASAPGGRAAAPWTAVDWELRQWCSCRCGSPAAFYWGQNSGHCF